MDIRGWEENCGGRSETAAIMWRSRTEISLVS